jgi:hypothetical protein
MYYHATPLSNVESIKKNGLIPVNSRIYMSETQESAISFARDVVAGFGKHEQRPSQWALFGVSLSDLTLTDFQRDPDSGERNYYAYIEGPIPPSHVWLMRTFNINDEEAGKMASFEDRMNELAEYIAAHDKNVAPETVGSKLADAIQPVDTFLRGEERRKVLREKSYTITWLKDEARKTGAWWSGEGELDEIMNELNKTPVGTTAGAGIYIYKRGNREKRITYEHAPEDYELMANEAHGWGLDRVEPANSAPRAAYAPPRELAGMPGLWYIPLAFIEGMVGFDFGKRIRVSSLSDPKLDTFDPGIVLDVRKAYELK